jgi:restriction system protein
MLRVSDTRVTYSSRGNPTYQIEMWHDGLRKHRLIRGSDRSVVTRKSELQALQWSDQWSVVEFKIAVQQERARTQTELEERRNEAARRTQEAQARLSELANILSATLAIDDRIDWDKLRDNRNFSEPKPTLALVGPEPGRPRIPPEPQRGDVRYQPEFGMLDHLIGSRKRGKIASADSEFSKDHDEWTRQQRALEESYWKAVEAHTSELAAAQDRLNAETEAWGKAQVQFIQAQEVNNQAVERKRLLYLAKDPEAVHDYCDLVLSNSEYPGYFPKEFDLQYIAETGTLVVDYSLPSPDDLPSLREVKYVAARSDFVEQHLPENQRLKLYDDVLYQTVLRTIHELFEADLAKALQAIVLNGYVSAIDRSKGTKVTSCLLSLRADREQFSQIELANVDARACFKAMKGVGSSKLHGLSAIAPILQLRREDGRFVAAHDIANTVDERTNLASMDWEDFEHLIRQVFEQEFSVAGGEVKVTRTSRDGGVDAIAFDPDPIRGGKIVIQAKRYTNTVGVSAVRDLFGTVMNEGANKGILVTTSDYGPDAYSFAAGKPLVLLNGANLLFMMEKHGHPARIDIVEARRVASENIGEA